MYSICNIWFKNVTRTTDLQLTFFLDKKWFDIIVNVLYIMFNLTDYWKITVQCNDTWQMCNCILAQS